MPRIALGVAAWMRYVTGVDEKGAPIDVRDPLADAPAGARRRGRAGCGTVVAAPCSGARDLRRRFARERTIFGGRPRASLALLFELGRQRGGAARAPESRDPITAA